MEWTVVTAVNNEEVLKACLLASPGLGRASELILERGHANAAAAYNSGLAKAKTDLVAFIHQDAYLPGNWASDLQRALDVLARTDPNWGVLGVFGPLPAKGEAGFVYDGGWRRVLGKQFDGGVEVESLDEVVLVLRKASGIRFDPQIPGFHMYGADICLQARSQGRKSYAIAAFCIHNTNQYGMLPWQFWKAYLAMRRKWQRQLPIRTSCTEITKWCWPMVRWSLVRAINLATGRDPRPFRRVNDPGGLYRELISSGRIAPLRMENQGLGGECAESCQEGLQK